ncbi:MAG TPA: hypothetical protein VFT61_02835 [Sphingomicrobium sp.]|nr:hypothetical protein [Sphingomicrobium sp.]
MIPFIATIGLLLGLLFLSAIALAGSWIVWSIGPYRRFREATHALETSDVAKVKSLKFNPPIKLRSLGHRRLTEVFDLQLATDSQIETCFGALFLKEEAIQESLTHLQLSCGIALATMVIGGLVVFVADSKKQAELAHVGPWELAPQIFEIIFASHLFLVTEMLIVAFLILNLLTSVKLILKTEKALR